LDVGASLKEWKRAAEPHERRSNDMRCSSSRYQKIDKDLVLLDTDNNGLYVLSVQNGTGHGVPRNGSVAWRQEDGAGQLSKCRQRVKDDAAKGVENDGRARRIAGWGYEVDARGERE